MRFVLTVPNILWGSSHAESSTNSSGALKIRFRVLTSFLNTQTAKTETHDYRIEPYNTVCINAIDTVSLFLNCPKQPCIGKICSKPQLPIHRKKLLIHTANQQVWD